MYRVNTRRTQRWGALLLLLCWGIMSQMLHAQGVLWYPETDPTLPPTLDIDSLKQAGGPLYAIGHPADGKGPLWVWDNDVFTAAVTDDTGEPYVRRMVKHLRTDALLYARIPQWDTFRIYTPVPSLDALEGAVKRLAAGSGMDTARLFPFLAIGYIANGTGVIEYTDRQMLYAHPIAKTRAQMIGFIGKSVPEGWRIAGTNMLVHFRLQTKYHAGSLVEAEFWPEEPVKVLLPHRPAAPHIRVNDTDFSKGRLGLIQTISLEDLTKFHGHLCDGLVEGMLALQTGLYVLFPDSIIDRTDVRVVSRASPCLTDAAIYLTGGRYQYNSFFVSNEVPGVYIIQRISNGKAVAVARREGVKPVEIDQLGQLAVTGQLSACSLDRLRQIEDQYADDLLRTPARQLFRVEELPDYQWKPILKSDFIKTDILNKDQPKCHH